jgi:TRAP-type C4-dicarboxylate transport system substrate-binding protein
MRRIDHHLKVRFWALACVVLAVVAVASGCNSDSGGDKAGNESKGKAVELVLANHEGGSENVAAWADAVERLSDGSIRIHISNNWRQGESHYDEAMLNEVKRGDVPLAAVMSRSFDEVGVTSFQPLAAPFLIDSANLERRVLQSDVAEQALAGTDKIGVVGLGLLPGDLRRPVGLTRPLAAPDDYRGARMYTREGKVAAATLEALGARPAHGPLETWYEGVDGAEVDIGAVRGDLQVARKHPPITSNVVLWDQPVAIVMNDDAFEELTEAQQRALRGAAAEARNPTSAQVARLAEDDLRIVCSMDPKLIEASPAEREALETAVEPVYRMIEKGPGNADAIATIRELKGDTTPDSIECRGETKPPSQEEPAEAELDGTFRTKVSEDELSNSPLLYDAAEINDENWGELTLRLADGRVRYSVENDRASNDVAGTYTTDGDVIKFQFDEIGETWGFRWSLYRGTLKLERDEAKVGPASEFAAPTPLLINPWERVD